MAKFPALLAKPPSVEQVDLLAAKFPKWVYPLEGGEGKRRGEGPPARVGRMRRP